MVLGRRYAAPDHTSDVVEVFAAKVEVVARYWMDPEAGSQLEAEVFWAVVLLVRVVVGKSKAGL